MAMRDGFAFRQHLRETLHAQTLRRDEEKIQFAVEIIEADLARGRAVAVRVDALGRETRTPPSLAT